MSKENRIDYLEEERKKIWERISAIENEINNKPSDYEAEAKQASRKTSEFRNKSEDSLKQIKEYEDVAKQNYDKIIALKDKVDYINEQHKIISANEKNTETLEIMFENIGDLEEKIDKLSELLSKGEETFNKISQLLKLANDKTGNINKMYLEIMGHDAPNEDGEEVFIPGLKDELEESYDEIEKKVNSLQKQTDGIITNSEETFKSKILEFETIFQSINSKIESLLPEALTAGLSHAYFDKRKNEEKEETKQTRFFTIAIVGMIIVSLIPFGVSTYLLINNVTLDDVLIKLPRMVLAILPLYVPVLWFAYSSNKKRNLSKRLIEEYTHKEVLSKTFEGLSNQISNIEDDNVSSDLRNRLLYNLLDITSDNPGKLISDYNKSDHPFMDVLDKSTKLTKSIEKLSRIPGLGKLTSLLENKFDDIITNTTKEVEKGFDSVMNNNKK